MYASILTDQGKPRGGTDENSHTLQPRLERLFPHVGKYFRNIRSATEGGKNLTHASPYFAKIEAVRKDGSRYDLDFPVT